MNDFVGNTLQNKFYACCCILLSGTRPKTKTDAHIRICGVAVNCIE